MDDNLKQEIKENLEASIRKFFKGKKVKTTHVLDNIFPAERRIRSLIGGLETSMGTTVWEPLAKTLARNNGFQIIEENILRPEPFPDLIGRELDSLRTQRETNTLSTYECKNRLKTAAVKVNKINNNLQYVSPPPGNGVDIYLSKDDKEYAFDIKTTGPNKGDFKKFNIQLLEWYAYRLCRNPDANFEARIIIPFNPNKKDWYEHNKSKIPPLNPSEDIWVKNEFWDFCSGHNSTWNEILQIFVQLGNENFGKEFEDIFYQKKQETEQMDLEL